MQQISPHVWAFIHFGLILAVTCAQMLVVYVLAESSKPPAGLGMFTVYFMAALLGWIALTLQQSAGVYTALDVPAVAVILNSFLLFLAAGQRAGVTHGRSVLGIMCVGACLSVFFLPTRQMFLVQISCAAIFFTGVALLAGWRAWHYRNVGDSIIAGAGVILVGGMISSGYEMLQEADFALAQAIALGVHSTAYVLVVIGFLGSVVIEYQHYLSQLTTEDQLTHLLNRRGLEEALQVSFADASRRDLPTTAIMVDIDHFKNVNNSFGRDVGDHVIRQVAAVLNKMSRASDVVARTGGEEFLLILPGTDLNAAHSLAERICSSVGQRPLLVDNLRIPITLSLGVASARGVVDLDTLSLEAGRAMYLAKRGGRNRVASVEHKPVHLSTPAEKA